MSERELKILIHKRGCIKGMITKFLRFLEENRDSLKSYDVESRLQKVESSFDEFYNLQSEIQVKDEDNDHSAVLDEFEENYFKAVSLAREIIAKLAGKAIVANAAASTSKLEHGSVEDNGEDVALASAVRLPILELPSFSGEYETWFHFKDTFIALIHSNLKLNSIQKYYYLNSCLKGSASQVISSLEISQKNYEVAWKLLTERFENEKFIINSHITAIFDLPMVNKENYVALRELLDKFVKHKGALEALGQPVEHWDALLVHIVINKVDSVTRTSWETVVCDQTVPSIKQLIDFLNNKCRILETVSKKVVCDPIKTKIATKISHVATTNNECVDKDNETLDVTNVVTTHCQTYETLVFLTTAVIGIKNYKGDFVSVRALLDAGSDANFITAETFNKLGIKYKNLSNISITGIGYQVSQIKEQAKLEIKSFNSLFRKQLNFLIINEITTKIPVVKINTNGFEIPNNINLADPNYNIPGKIDLLIGAEVFYELLMIGQIRLGTGKPTLRKSQLGWLVTGSVMSNKNKDHVISNFSVVTNSENNIQNTLETFWLIEEIKSKCSLVKREELECENEFKQSTFRDDNGKFVVNLPMKNEILGENKQAALKRFYNIEKKLKNNNELRKEYVKFMREYYELGHMELVRNNNKHVTSSCGYYIPHHDIIKASSSTTKVRVVFDASAKTDNGKSLNHILKVGPVVLSDLLAILLRFRQHNIVLVGDIEKMYRQIWINEKFRDFHKIFWRESEDQPLLEYKLKTVTYGTASASFLATRCLKELSNKTKFPEAAEAIEYDFYMDDLITGGSNEKSVIKLKEDIIRILMSAGFNLRKLGSNSKNVLSKNYNKSKDEHLLKNENDKTLGIIWQTDEDLLKFNVKIEIKKQITKRVVLSTLSQIFDPLGLVAPVVLLAKIFLQDLWLQKLNWDHELPSNLKNKWSKIVEQITKLNKLKIERHVLLKNYNILELHAFSDASEKAYGGVAYVKSVDKDANVKIALLCAKSRVAPLKRQTLPRLELCGALLLCKLVRLIKENMRLKFHKICYYTDSSIVMNWINSDSSRWKTFVGNRIEQIRSMTQPEQWLHVKGSENPADIFSLGTQLDKLTSKIWFLGPTWLYNESSEFVTQYKVSNVDNVVIEECKVKRSFVVTNIQNLFEKFSDVNKLIKVVAWVQRFLYNCTSLNKYFGPLSNIEIIKSELTLVKMVQAEYFTNELKALKLKKLVPSNSKLLCLNPFLDEKGVIRVGGRLKHANIAYNCKHPIVLPKNHRFTKLIIEKEHKRLLHAGSQAVLASVRENYWPLCGKDVVCKVLNNCVICFKVRPNTFEPLMGDLPLSRVQAVRPFFATNVDYAGSFLIKNSKLRNRTFIKSYLCVFVCNVTRAVHLELVTDLTSQSFIEALKRFVARRGIPKKLYSDNGTNFVGAKNEFNSIKKELMAVNLSNEFKNYILSIQIDWQFMPARSPHMGELHEAVVKSAKFHLKRILSIAYLTYEQLNTVICQVKAVLNSRPLIPLSNDPNDLSVLTPAHFLIGESLVAVPQQEFKEVVVNKLKDYARLQALVQHFWQRWKNEYLLSLQHRAKWKTGHISEVKIGSIVLLKEDNLPVQQWRMGRIIEVYPGDDGIIRVATVFTSSGVV